MGAGTTRRKGRDDVQAYELMHGNTVAMLARFDEIGRFIDIERIGSEAHCPVGTKGLMGQIDGGLAAEWWSKRPVPISRENLKDVMSSVSNMTPERMAHMSMGLCLSDQYWVRPEGSGTSHEDVSFFRHPFDEAVSDLMLLGHGTVCRDFGSPSCSTGGDMPKAWYREEGVSVLYKASGTAFGQEVWNEIIASRLCDAMGVEHVSYEHAVRDGVDCCKCPCCIDETEDIVPAIAIWRDVRKIGQGDTQALTGFAGFMRDQGMDAGRYIDQMIVVDYLMRNTDRHWSNFGLIRDAASLEYKRPMPLFDHGNSLYHNVSHIDVKRDGKSKLTGGTLQGDLGLVSRFTPGMRRGAERFPRIVDDVLRQGDMPRERREVLVSVAEYRAERALRRFDVQLEHDLGTRVDAKEGTDRELC